MTPAAVTAALSAVVSSLLSQIDEYLVLGVACRHDFEGSEVRYGGDTVYVARNRLDPAGLDKVPVQLEHETVDFTITDVTGFLLNPASLLGDVQKSAEILIDCIERSILTATASVTRTAGNPAVGITRTLLNDLDQMLFDSQIPDNRLFLITGDHGWKQIRTECGGQAGMFEVCSPPASLEYLLRSHVALHKEALCLVTRRTLPTVAGSNTAVAEKDGICFTVMATPDHESKSIHIAVHLLYAVRIMRDEFAVRIPIPEVYVARPLQSSVTESLPGPAITAPEPAPAVAITETFLSERLSGAVMDAAIDKLITIADSMADDVPDERNRTRTALRILERTERLTPLSLLHTCSAAAGRVDQETELLRRAIEDERVNEVDSRQNRVEALERDITSVLERLRLLGVERDGVLAEAAEHKKRLASLEVTLDSTAQSHRDALSAIVRRIECVVSPNAISNGV